MDEENYRSTYKMQRVDQLKTNSDTLYDKFKEDKIIFGKTFIAGHTLKKLSNLNANQIQLDENEIKRIFPRVY